MTIVARIRQLLSANGSNDVAVVEDVPRPVALPPRANVSPCGCASGHLVPAPVPLCHPRRATYALRGERIATPIVDSSDEIMRQELERFRRSGPSHLALIAANGSYLQVAGNAKRKIVEGHLVSVLGREGSPGPETTLASTAGPIEVRVSEVWTALEAADLFSAFAIAAPSLPPEPAGYHRDDRRAVACRCSHATLAQRYARLLTVRPMDRHPHEGYWHGCCYGQNLRKTHRYQTAASGVWVSGRGHSLPVSHCPHGPSSMVIHGDRIGVAPAHTP